MPSAGAFEKESTDLVRFCQVRACRGAWGGGGGCWGGVGGAGDTRMRLYVL